MKIFNLNDDYIGKIVFFLFILQFGVKLLLTIFSSLFGINVSIINVLILLIFSLALFKSKFTLRIPNKFNIYDINVTILFLLIMLIEFIWGFVFYSVDDVVLLTRWINFVVNQLVIVLLFVYIGGNYYKLDGFIKKNKEYKNIAILLYMVQLAVFLYGYMNYSQHNILFFGIEISYLYLGDIFAIYSIFIISSITKSKGKIALFLSSTLFLYLIGSRSSMLFFVFVFAVYLLRYFKFKKKMFSKISILSLLLLAILSLALSIDIDTFLNNRMLRILLPSNLGDDYSMIERMKLYTAGVENIQNNWFFGDLFAEYTKRGGWGLYIHNIISYWEEYGVITFLFIVLLCIVTLKINIKSYFKYSYRGLEFPALTSIYCILSTVFTRSYIYFYIWFAFALTSSLLKQNRLNEVKNESKKNEI